MGWRLADAQNRCSELVKRALAEGPQRVVRRDDAVVVLAEHDYEKLTGRRGGFSSGFERSILESRNRKDTHLA
jgi:prevent-host-death family protein